jgi:hypothetical protein
MSRYTSRHDGPLLPQEQDVRAALRDFTLGPDWTPAALLWRKYVDWWASNRWQWRTDPTFPGRYRPLTRRQFGAALHRVFPGVQRIRRLRCGRRIYGYRGLVVG